MLTTFMLAEKDVCFVIFSCVVIVLLRLETEVDDNSVLLYSQYESYMYDTVGYCMIQDMYHPLKKYFVFFIL
jgi:hypothetical protein